jgi:hypothetical protein
VADPRRMRIRKGRVMHQVVPRTSGSNSLESVCRRKHPVKGVHSTIPRAEAPADWWTAERLWYPDCKHCPADSNTKTETTNV